MAFEAVYTNAEGRVTLAHVCLEFHVTAAVFLHQEIAGSRGLITLPVGRQSVFALLTELCPELAFLVFVCYMYVICTLYVRYLYVIYMLCAC